MISTFFPDMSKKEQKIDILSRHVDIIDICRRYVEKMTKYRHIE